MKKISKEFVAILLIITMIFSINGISTLVSAATIPMKLSTSSVTLTVGDSKTVTLKNAPKGAKATWSTKNSKIAIVKNGKITAVKEGSTKVECKVTYTSNKKKVTKSFTVSVTVKKKVLPTAAPTATPTPVPLMPEKTNLTTEHKSANGVTTKDNGLMREELSSQYLIKNYMGQGWNLGNTMEASPMNSSTSVTANETAWGQPVTTQKMIDGIQKYGINTVRIPVAWSNMISDDGKYTINPAFMNRVEEIINYCLNDGMYVIINDHYDRGWWCQFGAADKKWRDKAWARYESFWTQIANHYKEYSDRLIFESANEELGSRLNDELDETTGFEKSTNKTGVLTEDQTYELVNQINQKFVDIVRGTGGNNTYRHLLIAGYDTGFSNTEDNRFVMPKDSANKVNKLSVSVHYYNPTPYCIAESEDNSWGYLDSWGTAADIKDMKTLISGMKKFSDAGYGVIFGEYGVCSPTKKGIPDFFYNLLKTCKEVGYLPVMWDANVWYDRDAAQFKYKDIAAKLLEITGAKVEIPEDANVTGQVPMVLVDENALTKVFTWEGRWKKNDGSNVGLDGTKATKEDMAHFVSTTNESNGMNVSFNSWGYQSFISPDWSKFTKPCVRLSFETDDANTVGALTVAYCDAPDTAWKSTAKYDYSSGWDGKCVQLDLNQLKKHKTLMVSTGGAPVVTKIEIFDAAK